MGFDPGARVAEPGLVAHRRHEPHEVHGRRGYRCRPRESAPAASSLDIVPASAPRVRFAPSPTGYFHVGGAKTALYNWIYARQHGGTFVLRIEDTDAERNRDEWIDGIQSALRWIGVEWDEGPYFQSQRTALHVDAAARLHDVGQRLLLRLHPRGDRRADEGQRASGLRQLLPRSGARAGRGPRAAIPHAPRGIDDRGRPHPRRARVRQRADRGLRVACARTARRCSSSRTSSTTSTCASRTSFGRRSTFPNTPKAIMLWQALDGGDAARVRARAAAREREAPEALEASRSGRARAVSRRGLPARGDAELPDAARMGAAGRPRDHAVRRARRRCGGSRTCTRRPRTST